MINPHHLLQKSVLPALGFLLLLNSSCDWNKAKFQEEPVLRVESLQLTTKEFADRLAHQLSKYDALTAKDPKIVAQMKKSIEQEFIVSALLELWATKNNLSLNKADLDLELKNARAGFPDDFAFREELTKQGLSVGEWQKNVEKQVLEKMVFAALEKTIPAPTENEIMDFYTKNKSQYQTKERIYLQQIVLANNADANQVKNSLKSQKSFEQLAKKFSITPEGQNGGIVGWVEKGALEVFDQAFLLPLGKVSEVIQSPYGSHIMLVLKKEAGGPRSLTSVRADINRKIQSAKSKKKFSLWLEEQLRSVHVFKDQSTIDKMFIETRKD